MPLPKGQLNKFRAQLTDKQAELSGGLRNRDEIAIEKAADALDEVQLAGERELAICNLDRESNLLRSVRAAFDHMTHGSYGVCLHCEEEINPKRLAAVPWTAYCIQCQEAWTAASLTPWSPPTVWPPAGNTGK